MGNVFIPEEKIFHGRELIVIAKPDADMRVEKDSTVSSKNYPDAAEDMTELLKSNNARIRTLFGKPEEWLKAETQYWREAWLKKRQTEPPDRSLYYWVSAKDDILDNLAEKLLKIGDLVASAYVKPPAELPSLPTVWATPDFSSRQGYLKPAPEGIDAEYAWNVWGTKGGMGDHVNIIDIEFGWHFIHEDLIKNLGCGGLVYGYNSGSAHGTAVLGIISGDHNGKGIQGISPNAYIRTIGIDASIDIVDIKIPTAQAIDIATYCLWAGDIILLEIEYPGPRSAVPFRYDTNHRGYIPVEWWPDIFTAISWATFYDIIVVEAGGNGGENLDDPIYNTPQYSSWYSLTPPWTNPFSSASSEAVIVGAGQPPSSTDPTMGYTDRARCGFSNHGSRIDAHGWGYEIVTTGRGNLQGPGSGVPAEASLPEEYWYRKKFSGTSGASPMIVGALACLQGILLHERKPILTPGRARNLLQTTGSPQIGTASRPLSQRIGNRPNLVELIAAEGLTT